MKSVTTVALVLAVAATGACNRQSGGANTAATNASTTTNSAAAVPAAPAAATAAAQPAAGEAEVRAFLDRAYAPYAVENGTGGELAPLLEPELAAALEKRQSGYDVDPVIDAQDWTAFRPTYENVQLKGDRAIATATFNNGEAKRIDYQLLRTAGGWKIYDIQSANGGSFRERIMNNAE